MKKMIQISSELIGNKARMTITAIFTILYLLLASQSAFAQDGSLDTTFDGDGIVTTNILTNDFVYGMAVQTDGKIVAVGQAATFPLNGDFGMVRYNTNGSLDALFGTNGKVATNIGSTLDIANDVVIQADGKIVVIGETTNASIKKIVVVRYNTDGSLDTSFDSDGIVITSVGNNSDTATSVVLQTNGKIVVVGYSKNGSIFETVVLRYNTDGSLDSTFDNDGIVITNVNQTSSAEDVALQPDGKIVIIGTSALFSFEGYVTLVRYNSNGSLDTTFDSDGIVTTNLGNLYISDSSIAIQADGKIVVSGGLNNDFYVVRYNTNGSLDTTFGTNGFVSTNIDNYDFIRDLAIQSDGKIVVIGFTPIVGIFIIRYNINGSLDTTFDFDGIVTTLINGSSSTRGYAMAIQTDGKILVAGLANNGTDNDFAIARYNNSIPLLNNNCSSATSIDSFTYSFVQTNGGATSGGYINCSSNEAMNDGEWYSFVGNGNNVNVTLTNVQSSYDPKIGVYTGTCGALNCTVSADIGFDGDGESITIPNTIVGTTYYINIGHFSSFEDLAEGNFTITVTDFLLSNDDCANAIQINSFPYSFIETNGMLATNNGGNDAICTNGMNDGEWFRFIGNGTNVSIALTNVWPTYDPQIGVYSGNCFSLVCVNTQDNGFNGGSELLTIPTVLNTIYYINIGQYSANSNNPEDNFSITVTSDSLANTIFENSSFKVYPNPVHDFLNIESDTTINKIAIYNLLGQEVFLKTNENITKIDLSELPKGTYIARLLSDKNDEKTIKIIKN